MTEQVRIVSRGRIVGAVDSIASDSIDGDCVNLMRVYLRDFLDL